MKLYAVRLNPDPREGLPYSKYPTLEEYRAIHKTSPMNGFHEAANFLPEAGIVKGYLPPRHLSSMKSGEGFCLITVSAKTADQNGDMIFGIQACCKYIGETKRVGIKNGAEKLGLTFHYSCPFIHSLLFDKPIEHGRELIVESDRDWRQGPTYEIQKRTLNRIIATAIKRKCVDKSNKKLKAILSWINKKGDSSPTIHDEVELSFEKKVTEIFNEGKLPSPKGSKTPMQREVINYQFVRNVEVSAYALLKAKGICQDCKLPAPFISRTNRRPFLEVHHIVMLKDGGSDTIENVTALCPNCHRKRHYG